MSTPQNPLLTEKQVAQYLGISVRKLQSDRRLQSGIPYVKIGKSVRYQEVMVQQFLHANLVSPLSEHKE